MVHDNATSPLERLLTPTIFFSTGLIILNVTGFNNLSAYIQNNEFYFMIALLCFVVAIYLYILFFLNNAVKAEDDILYLAHKSKGYCYFIDKNGNTYKFNDSDYQVGRFYIVNKTYSFIKRVKGITNVKFKIPSSEGNYLNNLYLPFNIVRGKYAILFIYVLLTIFVILDFILSSNIKYIFDIICVLITFEILFDAYHKIKNELLETRKGDLLLNKIRNTLVSILLIIISIFFVISIVNAKDIGSIIILVALLSCTICLLISLIMSLLNRRKHEKIFRRLFELLSITYIILLLVYILIYGIINNVFAFVIIACALLALVGYNFYKDYFKK